jgi:hypothetical protein
MRRISNENLNVEIEIGYLPEVVFEHCSITMQTERPAIVANVTMNEAAQLRPVLPVEAGNVIAIDVGKLVLGHSVSIRCRHTKWAPGMPRHPAEDKGDDWRSAVEFRKPKNPFAVNIKCNKNMLKPLLRLLAAATDRVPSLRFAYGTVGIAAAGGLARVLLRRLVVEISIADDARTPFQCCLNGRLGRGGGGLALVPARLCRMDFQALCPE